VDRAGNGPYREDRAAAGDFAVALLRRLGWAGHRAADPVGGRAREGSMEVRDKVALITGAAVGTGRAIALALAERGCHVAINYSKSKTEAEATAGACRDRGVKAFVAHADVAVDADVRRMVAETVAELGRLDVLVNNAGITSFIAHDDFESVTEDVWERILGVNLKGVFYCVRAATPELRKTRGTIVNISSVAGVYSIGSSVPYIASKGALNSMTVALARALAPEIRVNAVAPGFIDTRWWHDRPGYEQIKEMAVERTPLKRVCSAEDVAQLVLAFIANDLLTGQITVIDGGMGLLR